MNHALKQSKIKRLRFNLAVSNLVDAEVADRFLSVGNKGVVNLKRQKVRRELSQATV